jgi:hypothetical protein
MSLRKIEKVGSMDHSWGFSTVSKVVFTASRRIEIYLARTKYVPEFS